MSKQHVIVISYDAFGKTDWEHAKKQPNLAQLIENGSYSTSVETVYPSLTYVIHSSYVTGMYPNKHGVFHNTPFQPFKKEEDHVWHWYRSQIKAPTIYEAAMKNGLTVCGLLWPVSGKARIRYNIPEIKAIKNENQALKIFKAGSPLYSLAMEMKYGKMRKGIEQPYLDNFTTACAVDTIKRKKPNLLMMHLIDLDDNKHRLGIHDPHIHTVIERMDQRIGLLVDAVKDAGIYDHTTFIIIGDHSQLEVQYKVHLNSLLAEAGLIYKNKNGWQWDAYVQSADGSAFVHAKNAESLAKAKKILEDAIQKQETGIEQLYTREQLSPLHVHPQYQLMVEAKPGYAFDDDPSLPLIIDLHAQGKKYATHGYSPRKDSYTSNFVVAGPTIKKGGIIESMSVVDLAPTLAKILQIPFHSCDGQVIHEIFKNH